MRSLQLQGALTEYLEAAAAHLHAAVAAGAEVPFELEQRSRRRSNGPSLYCYQPLTDQFIAERMHELEQLPSHREAARLLADFDGLGRYLASLGAEIARTGGQAGARAGLRALLSEVFAGQSDFELVAERVEAAFARLESSALLSTSEVTLVATLHGLTITSEELHLTRGLRVAQPHALDGLPPAASAERDEAGGGHLVVVLAAGDEEPVRRWPRAARCCATCCARSAVRRRSRHARLARLGADRWSGLEPTALGSRRTPTRHARRRAPSRRTSCGPSATSSHAVRRTATSSRGRCGASSWAASERARYEGLSDHLLALRALLEPEGAASGLLPRRLAALCATPERRAELTERTIQAIQLERAVVAGERRRARGRRDARERPRRPPARAAARRHLRAPRRRPRLAGRRAAAGRDRARARAGARALARAGAGAELRRTALGRTELRRRGVRRSPAG